MNYGIANLSIVPLRTEPNHFNEMVSQILFGETYTVLSEQNDWLRVQCHFDQLEGYIHISQHTNCLKETIEQLEQIAPTYGFDILSSAITNQEHIPVLIGSNLPFFDGLSFHLNKKKIVYNGQVLSPDEINPSPHLIKKIALKYVNAPYLWGGRTPFGIDTSGLVQIIFKLSGIKLPRESRNQIQLGNSLNMINEAREGDIAFFKNELNDVIHSGVILEEGKIIHSHGKVRIDRIDSHGIFNEDTKSYSHQLRLIKRIF